jgi:cold shock CspA family protein
VYKSYKSHIEAFIEEMGKGTVFTQQDVNDYFFRMS